jgi:hypothetical protein
MAFRTRQAGSELASRSHFGPAGWTSNPQRFFSGNCHSDIIEICAERVWSILNSRLLWSELPPPAVAAPLPRLINLKVAQP